MSAQQYIMPTLFQKSPFETITVRVSLLYFSLMAGFIYYFTFKILEVYFVPDNFKLDSNLVYLIFATQILASIRMQPGHYFDISQEILKKLFMQLIGVALLASTVLFSFKIINLIYCYLIFYSFTTIIFIISSREFVFFKHIISSTIIIIIYYIVEVNFSYSYLIPLLLFGFGVLPLLRKINVDYSELLQN